jgi:hypothetical protein
MFFGIECWVVKKQLIHRMSVIEMRMLRWISGNRRKNIIRNKEICLKIGVTEFEVRNFF